MHLNQQNETAHDQQFEGSEGVELGELCGDHRTARRQSQAEAEGGEHDAGGNDCSADFDASP